MYAVIEASGRQYRVSKGDEILLDGWVEGSEKKIEFDKVLLVVRNGEIKLGQPVVKGALAIGKVLEHLKGKKIEVVKFRAKSRYRRKRGFRQRQTRVIIEEIRGG